MKFNPILVLLAAALLGSCTKNEVTPAGSETNSINAIMENDATKTNVTDEGYFTWSTGDQIWLHTTGGGIVGTLSSGAGTANAKFSYGSYFGTMTDRAVYPYNDNHDISGNTLSVVLPDTYNLGANTNNTNAAMYAVVSNGNLKFNHLAGVMRFEFKNAPAGTNQFKITLDKKINGTFNADITQSYPTIIASETNVDAEKTITFNFNALEETSDLRIYVPLPVGEYGKLELELNTATETVWSYSKNVNNVIARRGLLRMPTVTMGGSIGGDIENGGDVGGDIENENPYIRFRGSEINVKTLGTIDANSTYQDITLLETNVTDFTVEIPESVKPWVNAFVDTDNPDGVMLVITISPNTTADEHSSYIRVRDTNNPEVFVEVTFTQEAGEPSITFASPEVESAFVAVCDKNGNNKLSYSEAATLVNLSAVTFPTSVEVSFNEFEHFTSVTTIPTEYFKNSKLTSIVFPNSLTEIGQYAFRGCTSLTSISLPENITLKYGAFHSCSALTELTIPAGINWTTDAFRYCTGLETVTIAPGVEDIPADAFSKCTSLSSIVIPSTVKTIWSNVFYGCTSLTNVTIPDSVTKMSDTVFYDCNNLKTVKLSSNITRLPNQTFWGCSALESIEIPSSVTEIGYSCFYNCSALKIVSVKNTTPPTLSDNVFYTCGNLSTIYVPSTTLNTYKYANYWQEYSSMMVGTTFN